MLEKLIADLQKKDLSGSYQFKDMGKINYFQLNTSVYPVKDDFLSVLTEELGKLVDGGAKKIYLGTFSVGTEEVAHTDLKPNDRVLFKSRKGYEIGLVPPDGTTDMFAKRKELRRIQCIEEFSYGARRRSVQVVEPVHESIPLPVHEPISPPPRKKSFMERIIEAEDGHLIKNKRIKIL